MTRSTLVAEALAEELSEYWPMEYELLALMNEQLSALLIAFLRANGAKNVGKPLRIPRPRRSILGGAAIRMAEERVQPMLGFRDFAKQISPPKKG